MKTITTTVYSFDELNDNAKEKAREWYRRGQDGDNYFAECVIEDAETCAGLMGIEFHKRSTKRNEPCVFWSGFYSQGDGACFEGSWRADRVKPGKLKEHAPQDTELHRIAAEFERIALAYPDASFTVKHSGHYSHQYCTDFDVDLGIEHEPGLEEKLESSESDLIEAARDFMQWIYGSLEKESNYQNADEQVDKNIMANDYTFTQDGKLEG